MIIDAHTHILPQRRLDGLSIWLGKVFSKHSLAGEYFAEDMVLEELSKSGVKYVFNLVFPMKPSETEELNLFNYRLSKQFKAIIPFDSLHIENDDKKGIINYCIRELGFFGFKLHPYVQGFSPDDEKLFCAYEGMEEFGKLLFIHTGFKDYYLDRRNTVTLPSIENLLKRFLSLTVIISRLFYPRLNDLGE